MKISREWLSEFVDFESVSDAELARSLTEIGHAVEGVEMGDAGAVLDIEFTTNRIDAMSHRGLARELAAALGQDVHLTAARDERGPAAGSAFSVEIDAPEMCSRYTGLLLRHVGVRPSSRSIARRLEAVGLRPINNIVDVTNYVMLALGHPLHAFDFERVRGGRIVVRTGRPGETIESLDGETRQIDEATVVIADGERAVALGGIIGGANSEIDEATTTVLLECAHFDPSVIRRTARRLGLRTDASYRFERGVDPADTVEAIRMAADLIVAEAGGEIVELVDVIAREPEKRTIRLRTQRLDLFSAGTVGPGFALDLFRRLEMEARPTEDGLEVVIPTWREDLLEETDLIEEALRFHGYDGVPASLPRLTTGDVRHIELQDAEETVRDLLVGCGMVEMISYSFVSPERNGLFSDEAALTVVNALTENLSSMRLTLFPGLVDTIQHNQSYGNREGAVFEVGRSYHQQGSGVRESRKAAFALFGESAPHWSESRRGVDYYDAKGAIEAIAAKFHVNLEFRAEDVSWAKGGHASTAFAGDQRVAVLGVLDRDVLRRAGVKGVVAAGEIDLEALVAAAGAWRMDEISRHPGIPMVLALLHERELRYGTILHAIRSIDVSHLREVGLWDRFVPEEGNEVKTTLAMWYQAFDRSLTQDEVGEIHERLTRQVLDKLPVRLAGS